MRQYWIALAAFAVAVAAFLFYFWWAFRLARARARPRPPPPEIADFTPYQPAPEIPVRPFAEDGAPANAPPVNGASADDDALWAAVLPPPLATSYELAFDGGRLALTIEGRPCPASGAVLPFAVVKGIVASAAALPPGQRRAAVEEAFASVGCQVTKFESAAFDRGSGSEDDAFANTI